jgi:hypothetical protein
MSSIPVPDLQLPRRRPEVRLPLHPDRSHRLRARPKRVVTAQGWIDYDYLIVGAGIRYNYEAWFGNDRKAAEYTKAMFPAAYIPNAEHFRLKQSIQNFKGGDLVMTLPPPPHRCPPSPYERACLIAGLFKQRKIKGKIIILDPKPSPAPITGGYPGSLPRAVQGPDRLRAEGDDQRGRSVQQEDQDRRRRLQLRPFHPDGPAPGRRHGLEGRRHRQERGRQADRLGRCRSLLPQPEGRSGHLRDRRCGRRRFAAVPLLSEGRHVANAHAKIVAKYITERIKGREPKFALPDNLCFMMVNTQPREAIAVRFKYWVNDKGQMVTRTPGRLMAGNDDNLRRAELVTLSRTSDAGAEEIGSFRCDRRSMSPVTRGVTAENDMFGCRRRALRAQLATGLSPTASTGRLSLHYT